MNYVVLDLETARSADDCIHCGVAVERHALDWRGDYHQCVSIGWDNKPTLGLSIGAYWDDEKQWLLWFDEHNLAETVGMFVADRPLLVSFNGIGFDFPLMRGLLRQRGPDIYTDVCDAFKILCAESYDILAEIWKLDSHSKFVKGLNSLDAIALANGLAGKLSSGAQAPRDWAAGKHADVLNYCAHDVWLTRELFLMACHGEPIKRSDGSRLYLPKPFTREEML